MPEISFNKKSILKDSGNDNQLNIWNCSRTWDGTKALDITNRHTEELTEEIDDARISAIPVD